MIVYTISPTLLSFQFGETAAFVRTDDPKLFPKAKFPATIADSTSGPESPDIELFSTPMAYKASLQTYTLFVFARI